MTAASVPTVCPRCRAPVVRKTGKNGPWIECTKRPGCKFKQDLEAHAPETHVRPTPPKPLGYNGQAPLPPGSVRPGTMQLDVYQQYAVNWRSGTAVVAAAAGSGKSTVLISRTAELLAEGWIPEALVLLVYNRAAAETLRSRLADRVGSWAADRVDVYTFHGWAYALLRHWYPDQHRLARTRILGTPGTPHPLKFATSLLKQEKIDIPWPAALDTASRCAEGLVDLDAEDAAAQVARCMRWARTDGTVPPSVTLKASEHLRFARAWRTFKMQHGWIEFADMLGEVAGAMQRHADTLAYLRCRYSHVMVDEAQDGAASRIAIAEFLGSGAHSLMFVGDLRQSIYSFSGARPEMFQAIAHRPNTTLLTLPVNRRSTQRIVEFANAIARGEPWNLGGDCVARPDAPVGEPVHVWTTTTASDEARDVILDITRRVAAGRSLGTVDAPNYCCLARTNAMLVMLEHAFVARGMPVRTAGSPGGVWASEVGSQLLSYLEAVQGVPTFGLVTVANHPQRYATKALVGEAVEQARAAEAAGQAPHLHARLVAMAKRDDKGAAAVARLGRELQRCATTRWNQQVLQCARWLGMDEVDDVKDGDDDKRACLEALVALAQQLGGLAGIYEHKAVAARSEREPAVLLSTAHKSKGAEWPVVYACGVREGALPHKRCEDVAEEKRLYYVMATRARDVLTVSPGGKPSPFLPEVALEEEEA